MNIITISIGFCILLVSMVIHEMAHAYTASILGDDTPQRMGRLSPLPWRHLDLFGSIILPIIFIISQSPILFGWAKPVIYNPYNFTRSISQKKGILITALAGPASNIITAILLSIVYHIIGDSSSIVSGIVFIAISINIGLALFNMIPIPPLDGHYIISTLFSEKYTLSSVMNRFGTLGSFIIIFISVNIAWNIIQPFVMYITSLLV